MPDPTDIGQIADTLIGNEAGSHDWKVVQQTAHSLVLRSDGLIVKYRPQTVEVESIALGYANGTVPDLSPGLIAASPEHGIIVMTDVGRGRSLADALLGDDRAEAIEFLDRYVDSMAELHRVTWGIASGPAELRHDRVDSHFALYSRAMDRMRSNESLGDEALVKSALVEVERLAELTTPSRPTVFTFGDMCPGNQVMTPGGFRFFDLEASGFMHPALDVAYLTIPFPTCWCAWELPEEVKARALSRYMEAVPQPELVEERIPEAEVFWTVAVVLAGLLVGDAPAIPPDLVAPDYREVIAHRLERSRAIPEIREGFPAFSELLDSLSSSLRVRWGEIPPLRLAPAFRQRPTKGG